MPRPWTTNEPEVEAIVGGRHGDPFKVLGLHQVGGDWVVRAFVPGAEVIEVTTLSGAPVGALERRHDAGFFEGKVEIAARQPLRYEARNSSGSWSLIDPYIFGPVLGPLDDYYAAEGTHLRLYGRSRQIELSLRARQSVLWGRTVRSAGSPRKDRKGAR